MFPIYTFLYYTPHPPPSRPQFPRQASYGFHYGKSVDEDTTPIDTPMKVKDKMSSFTHLLSDFWYNSLGSTCTCPYLFVVPFALSLFVATYHTCFPLFLSQIGARNTYMPATRTSVLLDHYSALLSVTDLCATYIYLFICVPSKIHILLQISIPRGSCNLGTTSSQVSRTSHRLYHPLLALVRTL